jgi:hypothetical protein
MITGFRNVSRKRPRDEKYRDGARDQNDKNNPSKDIEHSCITMTIAKFSRRLDGSGGLARRSDRLGGRLGTVGRLIGGKCTL